MELIYFILGFLFTVTGYGIVLLTKTKSSHTSLLGELHACRDLTHQQFDSSVAKHNKLEGDIKKISEYYIDVQKQMENDAYEGNTKLNGRITELAELFNEQGNRNKRLFDMADKQLRQQQNEIQQATNTLKKIVDDPTTLARY
jgi:hypothetical protein|tara:strand:+ start:107 stop:535 length:429 start_codon:yes stop_codon:yes gene_type:complete